MANAYLFVNKPYYKDVLKKAVIQAIKTDASAAIYYVRYFVDEPWYKQLILKAAEKEPQSTLDCSRYFIDASWAKEVIELAEKKLAELEGEKTTN